MAERYDNSRRSASAGRHRPSPARAAATRARSRVADVPVTRKILMTLMVMGAMTTAVGAGTFASLTASTTNATSVFSTGTLVLSDQVATGNTCFSNGTTPTDGGVGTATDVNDNASCDLIFDANTTATNKRPGENISVALHLQNAGTIAGTLSAQSPVDCTDSDPVADQPFPYGTPGTGCETVQLSIEDSTTCYWGDNMGTSTTKPYITGASLTYPLTIDTTNFAFKITVDGVVHDNISLTAGTYNTAALFAAQVHSKVSTWANASAVGNAVRIESKTATGSSNVTLNIPSSNFDKTALTTMGFIDGSTAAGPGKCALKTGEREHTLADFRTATSVTPLSLGTLAGSTTRDLTITLGVPAIMADSEQARMANFALIWHLTA